MPLFADPGTALPNKSSKKKLEHQAKRASKEPSHGQQWVIGKQKERSDYSCAFTRLR
jgi:hypothetical protein